MNQATVDGPAALAGPSMTDPLPTDDLVRPFGDAGMSRLRVVEQHQVVHLARRLAGEFVSSTPLSEIEQVIAEVLGALLSEAKFTSYIPLLTERRSRERLQVLGAGNQHQIVA